MSNFINLLSNNTVYYIISAVLAILVLLGIYLMSKVEKAKLGNIISASAILLAVLVTIFKYELIPTLSNTWLLLIVFGGLLIGAVIGLLLTYKVKMIQMPQLIGLLNGLGGLASLVVGLYVVIIEKNAALTNASSIFNHITAIIAIIVGGFTLIGSLVAAGKLHGMIPQQPIRLKYHKTYNIGTLFLILALSISYFFVPNTLVTLIFVFLIIILSFVYGFLFTSSIGGADMPIAISLLNSLSGVAGAISGLAINDVLLVSVGAIVGASGLLLTQIMCKSMNRSLIDILLGKTTSSNKEKLDEIKKDITDREEVDYIKIAKEAKNIIIVPGYGMAVAQAQHVLKDLADELKKNGSIVRYAIHPVAGRMPGHMNVLLVEANVDYEDLDEMDSANQKFGNTDLVIVVGANDVINPAAKTEKGSPIYDMPILEIDKAKHVFIFNYDTKPGYAGVDNPLYEKTRGVSLFLGNALDTLKEFLSDLK